jgi:hypothetical protein
MHYDNSMRLPGIYKGALSDPVEVALKFVRLDETVPAYETVSYVWS